VAVNIYQAVKQAMQDLVAPQLESLRGEITALSANLEGFRAEMRGEMRGVHGRLDGLHAEIDGLRAELNGVRGETSGKIDRLDERLTLALDLRERIVALEARLPR
jgi:hypothetical protein